MDAPANIRPADTVVVVMGVSLGMLLIPALGLFYGGMVRRKNVLSVLMQCFIALAAASLQWVIVGYTLAFGDDVGGGLMGNYKHLFLHGVGLDPNPVLAPTIPHRVFMAFELLPAALAPAIISGAVVERMKFSAYVLFCIAWNTLVYAPVAHWVWAPDGWVNSHGGMDFAGGFVVHLTAGAAAVVCVLAVGKRKGLDSEDLHPHNLTLTAMGTGLLWVGWIGWMVGASRGVAAHAAVASVSTILAGAGGIAGFALLELFEKRKVTLLGACTGAVAGLVAITPAAAWVEPWAAIAIGLVAGPLCHGAIMLKARFGLDDSLDVASVHGVGGLFGALALGVFASAELTGTPGGLLVGNADILFAQAIAALAVIVYTTLVTWVILLAINRTLGLRVGSDEEDLGLDLAQHGQRGYIMGEGELVGLAPRD